MNNKCSEVAVSFRTLKLAIMEHWLRLVKSSIPNAGPEELVILEDHIGEILDNLAVILETGEVPEMELGKAHGFHRAVLTKFTFQDILKEYSLLRETIIDYHYPLGEVGCAKLVHKYIDIVTKNSLTEYFADLPMSMHVQREGPGSESRELKNNPAIGTL